MPQHGPDSHQIVAFSERLGAIGDEERRIEAAGARLQSRPLWTPADIVAHAADASVVVLGAVEPFGADVLEALPNCVGIVRRGVGYDNVDVEAATRLGIVVAYVPGASVEEVSDHALALLLALERRLVPLDAGVRSGVWQRDPSGINALRNGARRLGELTLGVVGFGRIGRALAGKASGIYARIVVADPALSELPDGSDVALVAMSELFATADHISLHAPLTPDTEHLIDDQVLARLRPGAVIVNTARGGLVDEAAVLRVLATGQDVSFGLDVTEREPIPADDALLGVDRVVLSGHSAGSSTTSAVEIRRLTVDAVIDLVQGRRPEAVVNPEVLSSPALRARLAAR